jgi:hydrogenase maturation protease
LKKMKTSTTQKDKILILGIGNTLLSDEGIGVYVIKEMEKKMLPEYIELLDGGTGNFTLIGPMQEADRVIIIDATLDGAQPGTVRRLTPKFSTDYPATLTAHDIGLKDILDAFYLLGDIPEVILYAISIAPLKEGLSLELSPQVKAIIPSLIERILNEIKN